MMFFTSAYAYNDRGNKILGSVYFGEDYSEVNLLSADNDSTLTWYA